MRKGYITLLGINATLIAKSQPTNWKPKTATGSQPTTKFFWWLRFGFWWG